MTGDLVYFVIPAADTERARAFYGDLFGCGFAPGNVPDGYQITGSDPRGASTAAGRRSARRPTSGSTTSRPRSHACASSEATPTTRRRSPGAYARCRDDQGLEFGLWAPRA